MLAVRSLGTGRMASGLTRYAWHAANNPAFRNTAARVIQRIYRGARARYIANRMRRRINGRAPRRQPARMRIGMPVGRDRSRHTQTNRVLDLRNDRTLYQYDISQIEQGPNPNQRQRDMVNFRGTRICLNAINITNDRIFLNYAIVSPKSNVVIDPAEFFRSNAAQRGVPFDSPDLSSMDYHCRPLNTDVLNVVTHKRIILNRDITGTASARAATVMRYVKIRRQLRYANFDGEIEFCTTPIYFIWWCAREGGGPAETPDSSVRIDLRLISYFRNPRD